VSLRDIQDGVGSDKPGVDAPDSVGSFCTNCGTPIEPQDKFCARCGTRARLVSGPVDVGPAAEQHPEDDESPKRKHKKGKGAGLLQWFLTLPLRVLIRVWTAVAGVGRLLM